jgi:hypothetical protein
VDRAAEAIKAKFEVDETRSPDKRSELKFKEFGYRSVHLIAKPRAMLISGSLASATGVDSFEIQVRSILEHSWAEIEHEVIYKAGTDFPSSVRRRFARLAGVLEMLDGEFLALRAQQDLLIERYRKSFNRGASSRWWNKTFDAARLKGYLESARPEGLSWRSASKNGSPFPDHIDATCVAALKEAGLSRPKSLDALITTSAFRSAITRFAAKEGISAAEVSHLALVLIALKRKNPAVMREYVSAELLRARGIS